MLLGGEGARSEGALKLWQGPSRYDREVGWALWPGLGVEGGGWEERSQDPKAT